MVMSSCLFAGIKWMGRAQAAVFTGSSIPAAPRATSGLPGFSAVATEPRGHPEAPRSRWQASSRTWAVHLHLLDGEGLAVGAADPERGRRRRRKTFKHSGGIVDFALLGFSWECSWGSLGPLGGLLGASWALLGVSWGPLGAEGSKCRLEFPLSGVSWGPLRPSWGPLGQSRGRLGPFGGAFGSRLGCPGAVLGDS